MYGIAMLWRLLVLYNVVYCCCGQQREEVCTKPSPGSCFPNSADDTLTRTFVSTFTDSVENSNILPNVFEVSQTTPADFAKFVYNYIKASAANLGMEDPHAVANTAAQSVEDHLHQLTPSVLMNIFANIVANYLQSQGVLGSSNAASLAVSYADALAETSRLNVVEDNPELKLKALMDGVEKFLIPMDLLVASKAQTLASSFADAVKRASLE